MKSFCISAVLFLFASACLAQPSNSEVMRAVKKKATLASGCFWCTEAVFRRVKGVEEVVSGYSGGYTKDPTYEEVTSGSSGHAECIQITYFPDKVSYEELLEIFFRTHDPTTPNRQGHDIGSQYRSAIFYHDALQRSVAQSYIERLNRSAVYGKHIVTKVSPFSKFYKASAAHQKYYERNKSKGYCQYVIAPKIDKLNKLFKDKLKAPKELGDKE